ncbi:EAL domain-containing protein [Cyanobacterium aponinum UTEX 3221]|uniref:EAL domain-containing protein n=1 Tax=Cyanobacterium aponinum TaxID=379064 RepID=UPI002B4BCEF9|nr:EAL domain-containing protein [Cyanobacterium aponinum]WRL37687.1 EAL domain-containing protein [Cyanobacterium aponinum UTEX 3221]
MNLHSNTEQKLQNRRFLAGECIFREGDKGNIAYIIEKGLVEITTIVNDCPTVLNTLKEGEMFGELALVDGSPRSASAYAKTDVVLTVVTGEQVRSRIDDADPILKLLLMVVMKYFRLETGRLRNNKIDISTEDIEQKKQEYQSKIRQAIDLIRLESDLRNGFKRGELTLFYQPIINLKNNQIAGFEVLLRWFCHKRGHIAPDLFIPLAESTSLIIPIGEWILDQALDTIKKIKTITGKDIFLSINVAEKQISDGNFLPILKEKINQSMVKPSQIKLEILERSLFEGEDALFLVEFCRDFGLPLVIDDFGTGYANLAYLKNFQFDTVKIDKCFVQNLDSNCKDQTICRALIDLSHGLNMTTVAEGIENEKQLDILFNLGCNFGQGYLFSPPVCLEDAIALLQTH